MRPDKLAYQTYSILRRTLRAVGLIKPVRRLAGPIAGRLLFGMFRGDQGPSEIHGHRMVLASSGRYPPLNMAMDQYEPETTRLMERILGPGMVVIDVGAHVGYFTLLAARQVGPSGKVYSFEPEPANHALLAENIEKNDYLNITAINMAVSNKVGHSILHLTALDNGRHSTYDHHLPESGKVEVETTTLDAYLEEEGWPKVDLVKVDVEGAEQDVLQGMERLLQVSDKLKLIIEFNPVLLQNAGVDLQLFLLKPASLGFMVYCIDDKNGLLSLESADSPSLVEALLAREGSVNLLCTRE